MLASKMPSLRIDQSELKCKNGCDFYGNPQWQGYCSICHRDQMSRQRRAEKASSSSATLPKPESKKPGILKLTSNSSFSKFEEKRLRQNETSKKAKILKFSVFKKSQQGREVTEREHSEFTVPACVSERMRREARVRFPALAAAAERDARLFAHTLILDVVRHALTMPIDERADRVQRQYQMFMKRMETSPHFADVDADTRELLMDFVEKHAMSYLHELPSVVFSPTGTDDERLDRLMSERIQQLSWVGEKHLECPLDRNNPTCRQLLYKAISELLGMDSAASPGGKLARARRCCSHVVALCRADRPASADDLLPAIIFTVLKANPPRLISNINFVTRFCNAQRLMTGEGGYYFTNLCCAVSFIENLTAESLNMDKKEFDCYMAMPASIGGSSWAAALSLCAEERESRELSAQVELLLRQAEHIAQRANDLVTNATSFEQEIAKKVKQVLERTPLKILPRRELPQFGWLKAMNSAPLVDLSVTDTTDSEITQILAENKKNVTTDEMDHTIQQIPELLKPQLSILTPKPIKDADDTDELNILGFEVQKDRKSPQNLDWELKKANSAEHLSSSPLALTPFDSRSLDELITPDDLAPGLSNINYDIDLSDLSGENSIAEDAPKPQPKDPFSPEGIKKDADFDPFAIPVPIEGRKVTYDPFTPMNPIDPFSAESFDQFSSKQKGFDPFDVAGKLDPFAVQPQASTSGAFSPERKATSILDESESPTSASLLPSPLLPQSSGAGK